MSSHYDLVEQAAQGSLYRERYNIDDTSFEDQAEVDTIHQLFIANHLNRVYQLSQQTLDFQNQYEITGKYVGNILWRWAIISYQDISIYAQLADLATFLGDDDCRRDETTCSIFQIQKNYYLQTFVWSEVYCL